MKANDHHEDKALRRVLAEQEKEAAKIQLPEDFADRVMKRIQEEQHTADKRSIRIVRLRKIAASIAIALCVSGLAYAAWEYVAMSAKNRAVEVAENTDSVVTFKNVRLDEIVTRVGEKYNYGVRFSDEVLREWRFQISWDSTKSLSEFVELLNEFDGLSVTEMDDTLLVSPQLLKE